MRRNASLGKIGMFLASVVMVSSSWILFVGDAFCLSAKEILVVANMNYSRSTSLAKYYMERRNIPEDQLIKICTTEKEWCSRVEYESDIASRVRKYLDDRDPHGLLFRCIVLMYGVPLKVSPPEPNSEDRKEIERLKQKADSLREKLKDLKGDENKEKRTATETKLKEAVAGFKSLGMGDHSASVDSEIALVQNAAYPLSGWLPNPQYLGYRNKNIANMPQKVLMVSRLDGPSEEVVRRIIDDSLAAEKKGLEGNACFDARLPDPTAGRKPDGYGVFDASIHRTANIVRKSGLLNVVVDDGPGLFQPGQCSDVALYCGWYSLAKYVDAFEWAQGAVGLHVASSECATLKNESSQVWCKRMLEDGAAAVIGPSGEPYLEAFPAIEAFFDLLLQGRFTLAECYAMTIPFRSWRMVLVGDPLYNPFRQRRKSLPNNSRSQNF